MDKNKINIRDYIRSLINAQTDENGLVLTDENGQMLFNDENSKYLYDIAEKKYICLRDINLLDFVEKLPLSYWDGFNESRYNYFCQLYNSANKVVNASFIK